MNSYGSAIFLRGNLCMKVLNTRMQLAACLAVHMMRQFLCLAVSIHVTLKWMRCGLRARRLISVQAVILRASWSSRAEKSNCGSFSSIYDFITTLQFHLQTRRAMKIYPVKKNPHLDYLTSQQEQTPCGKVVYCDVGEEDGWMHRIIVDERRKVWVRWVQVGQSSGFDLELLAGVANNFRFFIVGEKLFVNQEGAWFGWKQFKSLVKKAKYGKITVRRQIFNQVALEGDSRKKNMKVRRVFKFNKDIYAILSYEGGFILKKIGESTSRQFIITLQNLNFDDTYWLDQISQDKSSLNIAQPPQLVLCLSIRTLRKLPIQYTMVLVSLNIHEKQLDMKLETVHQFIESEQPEKVHQKLSMCIKNEKVLITIGNLLLIREGAQTKWIISKQAPIEVCSMIEDEAGQHTIVIAHSRKQRLQICLYGFSKVLNFCQLSPKIQSIVYEEKECFIGVVPLVKQGRTAGLLINLTTSNYLLSVPIFSMSKIIANNRGMEQQMDTSYEEDLFDQQIQPIFADSFIGIKLEDFQSLLDSNNIFFKNALQQLASPQEILPNIDKLFVDSAYSGLHFWIRILETMREYATIFLYLCQFVEMLKKTRGGGSVSLPKNIKGLMELCQKNWQDPPFQRQVSIEVRQYNSILNCLTHMRQTITVFSCQLRQDGATPYFYEIWPNRLLHFRIILELGVQNGIHHCFNLSKIVNYLIYNMCICFRVYALQQMLEYQHLLRHILTSFTDFHPLVYLLADKHQRYLFNSAHFKNCRQLIAYERQENNQLFDGIQFIASVYITLEQYLKKNDLHRLTLSSAHLAGQEQKYSVQELAIPIFQLDLADQEREKQQICKVIEFSSKIVGNLPCHILKQRQILEMVDFMHNYKLLPELDCLIKDNVFIFGQRLQSLNSQLLSTLKILHSEAARISQYNLQIKYCCKFIPNQQFVAHYKRQRHLIRERGISVHTVISNYLWELHRIFCSFKLSKLIQFMAVFLEQRENLQIGDCSLIPLEGSRISEFSNSVDLQDGQIDQKDYVLRMQASLEKLRINLANEHYEVEEEVSSTVFTAFVIRFRGYLLDLVFNYESMERSSSYKLNQQSYQSLFKLAQNRKGFKISMKEKVIRSQQQFLIQSKHMQNVLQLCLKYRLSCLNQPIDQMQQILDNFFLFKFAKLDGADYEGLDSILQLIHSEKS